MVKSSYVHLKSSRNGATNTRHVTNARVPVPSEDSSCHIKVLCTKLIPNTKLFVSDDVAFVPPPLRCDWLLDKNSILAKTFLFCYFAQPGNRADSDTNSSKQGVKVVPQIWIIFMQAAVL